MGILQIILKDKHLIKVSHVKFVEMNQIQKYEEDLASKVCKQLDLYFCGKLQIFDLPIRYAVGTDFQNNVWDALRNIPYGATCTYGDVAIKIGNPKAVRAIGGASNKNPISIIVPCHRVIGAGGKLVGYAGGLERKEFLLRLEGFLL